MPSVRAIVAPNLLQLAAGLLLAALCSAGRLYAQPSSRATDAQIATLRTSPLQSGLRLDGVLDEAMWASADSIAELTEIEPVGAQRRAIARGGVHAGSRWHARAS